MYVCVDTTPSSVVPHALARPYTSLVGPQEEKETYFFHLSQAARQTPKRREEKRREYGIDIGKASCLLPREAKGENELHGLQNNESS